MEFLKTLAFDVSAFRISVTHMDTKRTENIEIISGKVLLHTSKKDQ